MDTTHYPNISRLLTPTADGVLRRYAIVDCAATQSDDVIYIKINTGEIQKHNLFTGELAQTADHTAPFLIPLDNQPELEQWFLENGWGQGWGIYFTSDARVEALLSHFRQYLILRAKNGRDVFFRFYDPVIFNDFLAVLSPEEMVAFFGPVDRFVVETDQAAPAVYERPAGELLSDLYPSQIVFDGDKRKQLSERWQARLLGQHMQAFADLGFKVAAKDDSHTITLEDASGSQVRLQKTSTGVAAVTGENRCFQYDLTSCKHPTGFIDPAGHRIDFDIQERHNQEEGKAPPVLNAIRMDGGRKTWVFDYDEMHHLAGIDYPDQTSKTISHDPYGNLTGIVDRNGNTTQYTYDFEERLTEFKNANGQTTRFQYEDLTAPSTIDFADGKAFGFEYTDAGALETFLAGNTMVANYDVDTESGSWHVNYTDGGQATFEVQGNKIVRATNDAGTVALSYDSNGHLIKETFHNRSVTYHRNETGQLTGITTPFDQSIAYELDGEQRICGIQAWSRPPINIDYHLNGALERITYPNGTRLEQHTDALGLPSRMRLRSRQTTLFDKDIQRDKLNRVTRITDGDQHVAYHYDKEGRLIAAQQQDEDNSEAFTIDAHGNRLADNGSRYTINEADRITQAGDIPFHYDALGNLSQGTCPRGRAEYTFTDLNRLKRVASAYGKAQYLYDAFGRRVAKKVDGVTTRYYWAQTQLLHEARITPDADGRNVGVIDYLFFPETPVLLAIRQDHRIHWAAFGHRYEVVCLTDEGGQLAWQARYDAYGRAHVALGEDIHQPFRLAGQYYDPESGLHYNLARYYDPGQGRFLSLDPLFLEGGSTNFYAYCNNDPINYIDPTGELIFCAILIGAAAGAIIGAVAEGVRQKCNGEETDGLKIAQAALIGGVIGAIGGGVGAAVEAAAAAGTLGTAMAASTLPAMAGVGFLSGAGASMAEQCAEAEMTGKGMDPLDMTQQALTDGIIGAGVSLVTFGLGGFIARRLRKLSSAFRAADPVERSADLNQKSRQIKSTSDTKTNQKGRQNSDHADKSTVGEPVNAVTGEVILSQTDFTLPGRIAFTWTRHYGSQSDYEGLLGLGWQTPADARLEVDEDGLVVFHDGTPGGAVFEKLPTDQPVMEASDGAMLSATDDDYQVRLKSGLTYHFEKSQKRAPYLITRVSDPGGNAIAFERDENGALTHLRDTSGQCIDVICHNGRIRAIRLGDKPLVRYSYVDKQVSAVIDNRERQKHFDYHNGLMVRHTDTNRLSFYYTYDDNGRCVRTWGDDGLYECHLNHRPYERSVVVTNALGHRTTYVYDKDRLPVREIDHSDAETAYAYDEVGRVIKITDPQERVTEYIYDAAGNVLEILRPDNNRLVFVYDELHRPIQMLDANGKIWEQRFDAHGRLIEKISPLDARTAYEYNGQGDLVAITDPEGRTTAYAHDDAGRVIAVKDNQGNTTRYQRDLLGNITAVIDPTGRTSRYVYDEASRLVESVPPSGQAQHFEWDGEGNLLLHTDPNGQQTRFEYGGVNEIVRRINADGTAVAYQYDAQENLVAVTNEKGQTHRFHYDHAGRVTSQTDYFNHTTRYLYDTSGQLLRSIDPLDRMVNYDYDDAGRLQSKTFENGDQEFFSWDANGNLTTVQSPGTLVERFYDAANYLIAEKCGEFVVEYQYDQTGRRTHRTTSHGNTVQYSYDENGAVASVQINDLEPVTIQRNQLGQIIKEQFSPHHQRKLQYNDAGLVSTQSIAGATSHIERHYGYDAAGNLIYKKDNQKGPWQFTYDPMGRITESLDPERQIQRFGYDPAGDLLEHLPDTGHSLRLARHNTTEYRFDSAGNLAERQTGDDLTRFTWDEHNRLTTARTQDDTRIDITYDALGRRHIKAVNGERTFFLWDGDALLSEQHEDGPVREYVYYPGTFEPLALIDGDGQVYYYQNDPNGLPQELTTSTGEIVWSATYDALGRLDKLLVNEMDQPLRMQGQYWDDELGLSYNRFRYFDPEICSFLSQDPLGLAAGENVYAYAPNVWGWVDPFGLTPKDGNSDSIEIYAFRGGGTSAFENFVNNADPSKRAEVYTGHVGISTDSGKTIYGFGPIIPENMSKQETIINLKEHVAYPGIISDDTTLFNDAIKGKFDSSCSFPIEVYKLEVSVPSTVKERVNIKISKGLMGTNGELYGFPKAGSTATNRYNCATYFGSAGVPLPEESGNLRKFIPGMKQQGAVKISG